MTIVFYECWADNAQIDKQSEMLELATIEGVLRESCSIMNPAIKIQTDSENFTVESMFLANYIYITEFDRYYYINEIVTLYNNMWEVRCKEDVLMSFKKQIAELEVVADRSQSNFNRYIPDGQQKQECRKRYKYWRFPANKPVGTGETPLINWTGTYLMAVAGDWSEEEPDGEGGG